MYRSVPSLICFEGEDVNFTPEQQAKVNAIAAEGKRALRGQLAKAEQQLSELSESKSLTEAEREQLREALEETRSQLRTKEENEKLEKQKLDAKYKRELTAFQKRADEAEDKYKESTIRGALVDAAAAHGAYSNSILFSVLQGDTSITEDGKVVVSLKTQDDDGKDTILQMSPREAVKWMKDHPATYGGLFKDYVAQGGTPQPGANGRVDVRSLSVEQVKKLYAENPRALGL